MSDISRKDTIQVSSLKIEGNLIEWNDTLIPITNIAMISQAPLRPKAFPLWTVLVIIIGLCIMKFNSMAGIMGIIVAVAAIVCWELINDTRKKHHYLQLYLNSGQEISILFDSFSFLHQVMSVMNNILRNKENQGHNITFDLQNCTIEGFKFADVVNNG